MTDIDKVIEGLEKVWDAFNQMEHEAYADYVFDAIAMLKKLKKLNTPVREMTFEEIKKAIEAMKQSKVPTNMECNKYAGLICRKCGNAIGAFYYLRRCPYCGEPVELPELPKEES